MADMTSAPLEDLPSVTQDVGRAFSEHLIALAYFRSQPPASARAATSTRTMVDVGAFEGETFLPYLAMGWTIHAFEPDPDRADGLARLEKSRLHLHRVAVSDADRSEAPWFVSPDTPSISTLAPFDPSHRAAATVQVTTLASALAAAKVAAVDFLKVDAEGFDLPVLRGFPWDRMSPEVVLCEFENRKSRKLGYGVHDLGDFLLARGYRVFLSEWEPIVRYGGTHRWRRIGPYPVELLDPEAWGNFIAVLPQFADRMEGAVLDVLAADRAVRMREIETLQSSLRAIRKDLAQRNDTIGQLRAGIQRREERIEQLKSTISERDASIGNLREALTDRNESISRLRKAVSDREDRLRKSRPADAEP